MTPFRMQFSTGYEDKPGVPGISPSQSSQIVAILSAGTFFGALGAAPFADHIGRRLSLILAVAVFTLGVILQTIAYALPTFLAGRYAILLRGKLGLCY
jgi:predicted MFS family arabinose efflux permease